jgi:hypothetical protein
MHARVPRFLASFPLVLALFGLGACQTTGPGEGREPGALSADEAARRFFEAYRDHDRAAAARVADPAALDKLVWDASAGSPSNLRLEATVVGWAIAYDGGATHLEILGDGHAGHRVVDVRQTAD